MKIFVVSAYGYWGQFDPRDLFEKTTHDLQIGGGETAMLHISRELAKRNDVTVFYNTAFDHKLSDGRTATISSGKCDGVSFLPLDLFVPMACNLDFDILISWDAPWMFRYADRGKVHVLAFQLNDPQVGTYDWEVDMYMHPSIWHAKRSRECDPDIKESKQIARVTNGIDPTRYMNPVERIPKRVIYSSSPDRGLHHLLRIWPEIASREPAAELHVFYDMQKWLDMDAEMVKQGIPNITSERAALIREAAANPPTRVFFHGGIGQRRLAEEQAKSWVMAYPCDPVRPTEGFSMTILEGIAAGCHVVTTNADAFGELWQGAPNVTTLPLPIDDRAWINTILDLLQAPPATRQVANEYTWAALGRRWEKELSLCLRTRLKQSSRLQKT